MFQTIDPNEDDVRYIITWGDNTGDITEFMPHDTPVILNHTWIETSSPVMIVRISATAEDIREDLSPIIYKWIVIFRTKHSSRVHTFTTQENNFKQSNQQSQTKNR